ncbi:MAG: phenylalanine--tRNA ligase subunit alpha [Nitrospirales bacterium]|nr:phenylalanine--tRNA ligase subunit alpha [Nitrospirales bacterium]
MNTASLYDSLHPLEVQVLAALSQSGEARSDDALAQTCQLDLSQISMAVGWLSAKALLCVESETRTVTVVLTEIGETYAMDGAPLEWIVDSIKSATQSATPISVKDLQTNERFQPTEISRAIGVLKKELAIRLVAGGYLELTGVSSPTLQSLKRLLHQLRATTQDLQEFQEFEQQILRQFSVKRGNTHEPFRFEEHIERRYALTDEGKTVGGLCQSSPIEEVSQLTPEMLKDGSWRDKRFRKYTINLSPPRVASGRRHPYRAFLDLVKRRLVGMGFQEMRGPLVETEFWDMDALFMPQFHPARDIHDVYFVKNPSHADHIPEPFLSHVSEAHEHGGSTGSTGWGYQYDRDRARRLVLRSQGTAVSARTLASNPDVPGKYFSIARCFRYDQVDATHATDFFQVEGIVLGNDIHFRTLLGLLTLFAKEMAQARESRFLPAYFPFTEPSVELHVRHPQLGWMELGGAGLLRPEVTNPLGVTVPVIAWGLGLDRMAMVALGVHDIRDLFSSDLEKVRNMRGTF